MEVTDFRGQKTPAPLKHEEKRMDLLESVHFRGQKTPAPLKR